MIIYDDAGYIAGVQSVLLEMDVDLDVNDLTKQARFISSKCIFCLYWRMHLVYDLFIIIIILIPIHIIFSQPVYVRDLWMGEVAWFTTAYFVDPLVICNGGRLPINFLLETFSTLKEIQSKIFQELQ